MAGSNASGIPRKYAGSLNITGLDVFGIQAVSIGSIAGDRGLDAVEIKRDQAYLRLFLSNGWLLGVQSINWDENMGPFLAAILRKEKTDVRKEVTPSSRYFPFGKNLWSRKIPLTLPLSPEGRGRGEGKKIMEVASG